MLHKAAVVAVAVARASSRATAAATLSSSGTHCSRPTTVQLQLSRLFPQMRLQRLQAAGETTEGTLMRVNWFGAIALLSEI